MYLKKTDSGVEKEKVFMKENFLKEKEPVTGKTL